VLDEIRQAIYQAVYDADLKDDNNAVLPIFYPNKAKDTQDNEKPTNKHLRVALLPVSRLVKLLQVSIYTPAGDDDYESASYVQALFDYFTVGTLISGTGFELKVNKDTEENPPFKQGNFWVQPLTIQLRHKVCI